MLNLKNFPIEMDEINCNFVQMKEATKTAVKSALASAMLIANQVGNKLHIKSDGVEITIADGKAMVISKEITIVADTATFIKMDYDIVDHPLHDLTDLLNSLVCLGVKFQMGFIEVDTEFSSKGLGMSSAFLNEFYKSSLKHVNIRYQGHSIVIDNGIEMDGKTLLRDGVYYYYENATRILTDLLYSLAEETKGYKNE